MTASLHTCQSVARFVAARKSSSSSIGAAPHTTPDSPAQPQLQIAIGPPRAVPSQPLMPVPDNQISMPLVHLSPDLPKSRCHIFTLSLRPQVRPKLLLRKFQCALIFPDLQKLLDSFLVGRKSDNLADE